MVITAVKQRSAAGPTAPDLSGPIQLVRYACAIGAMQSVAAMAAAAAHALDANEADLAIVRRDIAYPQAGQVIAELRESFVAIIVPAAGSQATGGAKAQRKQSVKAKKLKAT